MGLLPVGVFVHHMLGHERASYPLGLAGQMVVSHHVDAGIEPMPSGRASIAPA